jgi:hypothetical protein
MHLKTKGKPPAMYSTKEKTSNLGRSYVAIRREEGKSDTVKHFPDTASELDVIDWCEADGYEVIRREIIETPNDQKYISFTIVEVQSKSFGGWKSFLKAIRNSSQFLKRTA